MDVITIESQAFKDLAANINTIAKFVTTLQNKADEEPKDGWVDSYEVCTFLNISTKTLQRLRTANTISYSKIGGKSFYKISEIQRLLNENIVRRGDEQLQNLINNHRLHLRQKRTIKADKKP